MRKETYKDMVLYCDALQERSIHTAECAQNRLGVNAELDDPIVDGAPQLKVHTVSRRVLQALNENIFVRESRKTPAGTGSGGPLRIAGPTHRAPHGGPAPSGPELRRRGTCPRR